MTALEDFVRANYKSFELKTKKHDKEFTQFKFDSFFRSLHYFINAKFCNPLSHDAGADAVPKSDRLRDRGHVLRARRHRQPLHRIEPSRCGQRQILRKAAVLNAGIHRELLSHPARERPCHVRNFLALCRLYQQPHGVSERMAVGGHTVCCRAGGDPYHYDALAGAKESIQVWPLPEPPDTNEH